MMKSEKEKGAIPSEAMENRVSHSLIHPAVADAVRSDETAKIGLGQVCVIKSCDDGKITLRKEEKMPSQHPAVADAVRSDETAKIGLGQVCVIKSCGDGKITLRKEEKMPSQHPAVADAEFAKKRNPLKPCPQCDEVPEIGYCCGEYFIFHPSKIVGMCFCSSFSEMHSSEITEIEAWNREVSNYEC